MQQSVTMKAFAFLVPIFAATFGAYLATGESSLLHTALPLWTAISQAITLALVYDYGMKVQSRTYFLRADLMFPTDSPYYKVLMTGNDHAHHQLLRMNKFTFDRVMHHVRPEFKLWRLGYYPDGTKRPGPVNMLDATACIALTLTYLGSTTQSRLLELIYGVGHAVLSRDLHDGFKELLLALEAMAETEPIVPNLRNMLRFAEAIEAEHGPCPYPGVRVWGFIDGLRLLCKEPDLADEQTLFYNGWMHTVGIVNSFLFTPDGKICASVMNVPGAQHDYAISNAIFQVISIPALAGGVVAGDSAFCSAATNTFIAAKDGVLPFSDFFFARKHLDLFPLSHTLFADFVPPAGSVDPVNPGQQKRAFNIWIQAVRQSAEHGMRSFKSLYSRVTTALPADAELRGNIMKICMRLHNLNAHFLANHNQVTTQYLDGLLR